MAEKELSLGDLDYVKSGSLSDEEMDKLDGFRVKIARISIEDDSTPYGEDGNILPDGQKRPVKAIQLETEEFGLEQIGRNTVHRERYSLKLKDGRWTVSLHEKSKSAQFLSKYKIDKFENAIGKEVVLIKKTNPETKRSRISISI